jgi:glycosyltransferase involved in cell wall biosynthesis
MKIIISSGSNKFHLSPLASEMAKKGKLAIFITAAWPTGWQKKIANLFPKSPGWKRFLDRLEPIPEYLVHSIPLCEFILKISDILLRKHSVYWQQNIQRLGFWFYSAYSINLIKKVNFNIYHYRNCYGGDSVVTAKNLGAIALCDHSIAHPLCLDWMERNEGSWPENNILEKIRSNMPPLYIQMNKDLLGCDHVLVNSDFVKQTCIYAGMDPEKIHVVYLGIDDSFFNALSKAPPKYTKNLNNSILYAGGWQRRKGVRTIVDALNKMNNNWNLEIAGGIEPEAMKLNGMEEFLLRPNVKRLGIVPRNDLAAIMKKHRIFIFPSYCEGSARVIFEAMAAGCFVITTPNSGSIVEDRVHGLLVKTGDPYSLKNAIEEAINKPDWVNDVGERNAILVSKKYRQVDYGNSVCEVYKNIVSKR